MKKVLLVCFILTILSASLTGCAIEKKEEEKETKSVYAFDVVLEKSVLSCKVELNHFVKTAKNEHCFYSPAHEYAKVKANGVEAEYEVNDGVLTVFTPETRGETAFSFEYELPLENGSPFGGGETLYYAVKFYPIPYSEEDEIKRADIYKPSFSPFLFDFTAKLSTPKTLFSLSSGETVSDEKVDDQRILRIEGKNKRDFSFTSSAAFVNRNQGKIHYYFISDKDQKETLSDIAECVSIYDELFGEAFDELYVVKSDYPFSYASSGIVFVKDDKNKETLKDSIARYVSGEWWGQKVAVNGRTPFLQDGLRGFSALLYYLKSGNEKRFNAIKNDLQNALERRTIAAENNAIGRSTYEMGDDYEECVYKLGALAFFELYSLYGVEVPNGLKRFAKENAGKVVSIGDLYSAFDNKSEYTVFLDSWLNGKVVHALRAHTTQKGSVKTVKL